MFTLPTKLLLLIALFLPVTIFAADKHGCWEPMNWCLKAEASWSKHNKGALRVRYKNNCGDRVLIKACNEYKSGNEDCGMFGLKDGSSNTWATSKANGRYMYKFTGSLKSNKDGVCVQTMKHTHRSKMYTKP